VRASYGALDEIEQKMFLDIAIAFHGCKLKEVQEFWEASSWPASSCWDNLLDRRLVTLYETGRLDMRKVFRDMGRRIVGLDGKDLTTRTVVSDKDTLEKLYKTLSLRRQQDQVHFHTAICALLNFHVFTVPACFDLQMVPLVQ
jgi:hypothetical protein